MRKRLASLAFAFAVVVSSGPAFAAVISLVPSSQTIAGGGTATADLVISDLGGTLLGAFDIDISFDPTVLSFDSLTFGPFLGDPDPLAFETVTGVAPGSGVASFFELSLLSSSDLSTLQSGQSGSFTLATLIFDAIGPGTSPLGIGDVDLSDDLGNALADPGKVPGEVQVVQVPVPAPATIWLFAAGLGGLLAWARRKRVI